MDDGTSLTADSSSGPALRCVFIGDRQADREVWGSLHEALGLEVEAVSPNEWQSIPLIDMGCLILMQESLESPLLDSLSQAMVGQEAWSELPVIILVEQAADLNRLQSRTAARLLQARVTAMRRPVVLTELKGVVHAVMASRQRQLRIRDQLEREDVLRRELNHRVKNIISTVQSICGMTLKRQVGGPHVDDFIARLSALARVHDQLHKSADEIIQFETLCNELLAPYSSEVRRQFQLSGDIEAALRPEAARTLALVLHELVTNALKYGALSTPNGEVKVSLVAKHDEKMFTWSETGGPTVAEPKRAGYGSKFIRSALASIFEGRADLAFHSTGISLTAHGPGRYLLY
ncbi:sensor histidine kinase [Frigidibacter sp. MR17.14]|uniref:sensor histidine kinase n=1 Tax=Frigidibacter sp. MR17.14 TaxID=3126509 RepID=UPI003012F940